MIGKRNKTHTSFVNGNLISNCRSTYSPEQYLEYSVTPGTKDCPLSNWEMDVITQCYIHANRHPLS